MYCSWYDQLWIFWICMPFRDDLDRVVAFTQYPQYSCSTTGSSLNVIYNFYKKRNMESNVKWSVIDRWPTHPGLVEVIILHLIWKLTIKFSWLLSLIFNIVCALRPISTRQNKHWIGSVKSLPLFIIYIVHKSC
jgi:protoheme ferro-lyase